MRKNKVMVGRPSGEKRRKNYSLVLMGVIESGSIYKDFK
jgi:hypothetical protein